MAKTSPKKSNAFKACTLNAESKGAHKKYMSYRTKLAHSKGEKFDQDARAAANLDWKNAKEAGKDIHCKDIED